MGSPLFRNRFRVSSARRVDWDYRWAGVYHVTVCVQGRVCCLGSIADEGIHLTRQGEIVAAEWNAIPGIHPHVMLDEWIIMPDHLHGILIFEGIEANPLAPSRLAAGSLGAVIGQFKKRSTKRIRAMKSPAFAWQQRFYDQILKDPQALETCRSYIRENPKRAADKTPSMP